MMKNQLKYSLLSLALMLATTTLYGQSAEDYYAIAGENNPEVKAKFNEFNAAMEQVAQANSLPDPNLSLSYFISPVETRLGPQRFKISLSQMFPWFKTLQTKGMVSKLMAEARYQEFIDVRNKLYFEVAQSYYPLYEIKELIRLQQQNLSILESYKIIAEKKFENSQSTMVDVLRVDLMMNDILTEIAILKEQQAFLSQNFNTLLNRDLNETIALPDTLKIDFIEYGYRKDSLLDENPKLQEIEWMIQAMEEKENLTIKQSMPSFSVGLDYVIIGKRTDMVVADNGRDAFMPMVTMSLPIYRKKYKAATRETELMQEAYRNRKENTINKLTINYEKVWFELTRNQKYITLYQKQIKETGQALHIIFTSYANSGRQFEEVLRLQQQLIQYDILLIKSLTKYKTVEAELNYITAKNYDNESK